MNNRFVIEQRSGIIAIYDTEHEKCIETQGCHSDYPWVIASWKGHYVTPPDPECLNGTGHWVIEKRWIDKAHEVCATLNTLAEHSKKYMELLDGVARCFPEETRHETALRYIVETENKANETIADQQPYESHQSNRHRSYGI